MDHHACNVLEFPRFLQMLANYASCDYAAQQLLEIEPSADLQRLTKKHRLCSELMGLLADGIDLPRLTVPDLQALLQRVRPADAVLGADELAECQQALKTTRRLADFKPVDISERCPDLHRLQSSLAPMPPLLQALERTFGDDGEILDSASRELRSIRQRIRHTEQEIRRTLDAILRASWTEDVLQEKFVTLRNGRHVLPVRREMKGRFPGVVHDHSDSGQTLFMEPSQALPMGNELADLILEERDECKRIMADLSGRVRHSSPELRENQQLLAAYAVTEATARWADDYACTLPQFGESVALKEARHPLLEQQLRRDRKGGQIVPLDLALDSKTSTLVITGSNSGGKTVTLKTIGLISLIAQAGLPVPAAAESRFKLFGAVFADIGDEQSLTENLSTFTGHLNQVNHILGQLKNRRTQNALILLDELGTGTDPLEGGALACAVLDELTRYPALTIATTHLGSIKSFVHEHAGMVNGAVRFNTETLQPEYALDVGTPDHSHALRIAERLGVSNSVIHKARAMLSQDQLHLEGMLAQLDEQRREIESERRETQESLQKASHHRDRLKEELEELRTERKKKLHDAYIQAEQIVANTRKQMEGLIADVAQARKRADDNVAAKAAAQAARTRVNERQKRLDQAVAETQERPREPAKLEDLQVGDQVWVVKLGANAEVRKVLQKRGQVVVRVGHVDFTVRADQIGQPDESESDADEPRIAETRPRINANAGPEINLIGKRVEEARRLLDPYLDDAALAGLTEVRIVHGLGTGRLKAGVHALLGERTDVRAFREGVEGKDTGGAGVTIVELA